MFKQPNKKQNISYAMHRKICRKIFNITTTTPTTHQNLKKAKKLTQLPSEQSKMLGNKSVGNKTKNTSHYNGGK